VKLVPMIHISDTIFHAFYYTPFGEDVVCGIKFYPCTKSCAMVN
jgi:hypothetical protein